MMFDAIPTMREQIAGGPNNRFVAMSNVGGWVMGYFDGSKMKMWKWAQEYTLADHFFMASFGGSYLNHQWLVCACTPMDPNAPAAARASSRREADVPFPPEVCLPEPEAVSEVAKWCRSTPTRNRSADACPQGIRRLVVWRVPCGS